jgi:hypothetical protein
MNNETRHRQIEQFVGREVFHCVSQLVTELTSKAEHFPDYEEELFNARYAPMTEEDYREAVEEHWIVSDWLANRLEERGECVLRDFFGLTVWGRTCSGQAISLDGVIGDIFDELHQEAAA